MVFDTLHSYLWNAGIIYKKRKNMLGNLQYKRLYFNFGRFGNNLDWFSWEGKTITRVWNNPRAHAKNERATTGKNAGKSIEQHLKTNLLYNPADVKVWKKKKKKSKDPGWVKKPKNGPQRTRTWARNTNEVGRKIVTPLKISPNTLFIFLLSRLE